VTKGSESSSSSSGIIGAFDNRGEDSFNLDCFRGVSTAILDDDDDGLRFLQRLVPFYSIG
jgi:hypothetical protein